MKIIEADYEGGVLRPVDPLQLEPGERVRLILVRTADPARWDAERLARVGHAADEIRWAEAGLDVWADELDREDRRETR